MNSSVLLNLESALVAHLGDGRLPFAAVVVGGSDPRVTDEETYSVLGQHVPLPAVVVTVQDGPLVDPNAPVYQPTVRVTVRHSDLRSTVATHKAAAVLVAETLWNISELSAAIDASPVLTLTSVFPAGEEFTKSGRALETTFSLNFIISGKDIT